MAFVESDTWFRARWFLVGSLAAAISAHLLNPQTKVVEHIPAPKVIVVPATVTPRPLETPDPVDAAPAAAARPSPAERLRPEAVRPDPAAVPPAAPPKPAAPKVAPTPAAPALLPLEDDLTDVRAAVSALRASPTDGAARARLERALRVTARRRSADVRRDVERCVTQAGFEGRSDVAAEALARCLPMLERRTP